MAQNRRVLNADNVATTTKLDAYADDSTLTTNGSTAKVISDNLTFNCDKINNWMAQN